MKFSASLFLLILMFFECNVFRLRDKDMFNQIFSVSARMASLFTVLLVVIVAGPQRDNLLIVSTLVVMVPLYILRRNKFIRTTDPTNSSQSRSALLSDGIGLIIKWLYTIVVGSMLGHTFVVMFPGAISEFSELIVSAAFSSAVVLILIYFASKKFSSKGFFVNVSLVGKDRSKFKLYIAPMMIGLMFAGLSAYLLVSRDVHPDTPLSDVMQTTTSTAPIFIFLFLGLCVAPFVEEVTFRGYFFHIVTKVKSRLFAIISISLTFGALHMGQYWGDWMAITIVSILGFVLTFMRVWANSTIASVVTHYSYNIGVTILPVIFFVITNPAYVEYQVNFEQYDKIQKEALLQESIEVKPRFYDAYNDLAWLYAEEDMRLEEGLELIDQALEFNSNNKAYLDTKAALLEKLDRVDEANIIRERIK